MSFALTYGSFGDVITTIQLVQRLAQTLSESQGSARQLQNLVVELRVFQNVLQQLMFFWESRRRCTELEQLANIARPAVCDCKDKIEAFLERAVRKYGRSLLRTTGSRKTFWDLVKAIQWDLCEAEDAGKLRDQLSRTVGIIHIVQSQAQGIAEDLNHSAVSDRIASLVDAERQADAKIDARFSEILENLEKGAKTMSRIEEISSTVLFAMSSIRDNVLALQSTVLSMEQIVLMLPGMMSRLIPSNQNMVYIEDALGWNLPIFLDGHPSWETIHSMIMDQFARHGSPGLDIIRLRRYALQDSKTGKDATFNVPFYRIARPGHTYAMSVLFHGDWNSGEETLEMGHESKCPKCGNVNASADQDSDVICHNSRCNLIYRRVVDVSHLSEKRLQKRVKDTPKPRLERYDNEYDDEDDDIDLQPHDIETMRQRHLPKSDNFSDGPEIFKRVRFLTSWEDRMESRGPQMTMYETGGDIHFWDTARAESVKEPEIQMHVSIFMHLSPFVDWITAPERPYADHAECRYFAGFVGRTREQSLPVLLLLLESKKARKRFLRVMNRLHWLGNGTRFLVLTAAPSTFGENKFYENWEMSMAPGMPSFEMGKEVKKRKQLLTSGG